jgi:hypothetical protein
MEWTLSIPIFPQSGEKKHAGKKGVHRREMSISYTLDRMMEKGKKEWKECDVPISLPNISPSKKRRVSCYVAERFV